MRELKPCPFCGNEWPTITYSNSHGIWVISCPSCDIRFRLGAGEKEKIKERIVYAWNLRSVCAKNAHTENL